jgi:hypothetical protein
VDCILVFMALEAAVLALLHSRSKRGLTPLDVILSLLAGVPLLLALRVALKGEPWQYVAVCLLAALVAHALDLARRMAAA